MRWMLYLFNFILDGLLSPHIEGEFWKIEFQRAQATGIQAIQLFTTSLWACQKSQSFCVSLTDNLNCRISKPTAGNIGVTVTVYINDEAAMRTHRSTQAMRRTLVEPGVPNGTPAVMTRRWPDPAISSR